MALLGTLIALSSLVGAGAARLLWARTGRTLARRRLVTVLVGATVGLLVGSAVAGGLYRPIVGFGAAIADCGVGRAPGVWREHRSEYECLSSEGWWDCYPPCFQERDQGQRVVPSP